MGSGCREILPAEVYLGSFGRKADTADNEAELEHVDQEQRAYNMFICIVAMSCIQITQNNSMFCLI